jgi:ATP-dependent Clp protease, protease subunit
MGLTGDAPGLPGARPAARPGMTSPAGVAGQPPGEPPGRGQLPDWLQERLFERRIVFIAGRLDETVAVRTAAQLMALDERGGEPITIHLDCADSTLETAFVVIDALLALRAPAHVHCRGQVGGPALGIVAAASRRSASAHTRFRLAQPVAEFSGTADEVAARSRQQQDLLWSLVARVAQATGRPVEEIAIDMRRGRSLDAREALHYGLVDTITPTTP